MTQVPEPVAAFLTAVEARDAAAVARCFTEDAEYHFLVPFPPAVGRAAIEGAFADVLGEVTQTEWEIVTSAADGDHVFLERLDHFWFGSRKASIECLGVLRLAGDKIAAVRDYADLSTWRARKEAAQAGV